MTELVAWVLFPLLALLACLGAGLLAERLAGVNLPAALVAPLGFAVGTCLVGFVYAVELGSWEAVALLAVATAAGLWLGRAGLIERFRPGPAAAAGGAAYALYMAPVVLSGDATFLGYNLLNDTAVHLMLVDYVSEYGRADPAFLDPSSFKRAAEGYIALDYPVGSHELLATLRQPLGIDAAHVYQPYLALAVALTASALTAALRRATAPARGAAVGAVVALAGHLLFSFNLQGGIKELTFLACLAAAAALGAELLATDRRPVRMVVLTAIPLAAGYAIYSWAALAWTGAFAVVLLALALFSREATLRRRLLPAAAAGLACFVLASLPTLIPSFDFADKSQDVLTAETELGPLFKPLKQIQVAGVWFTGDYRLGHSTSSYVLAGFALALALFGLAFAIRRRAAGPLLLSVPALVAWLAIGLTASPYAEAKAMAIASPAVLLLACVGIGALARGRWRAVGAVAALVLVASLALSDAYAYREARLAPIDRLVELGDAGERFAGEGPMLVNEFEEYAKHFARDAEPNSPYEAWAAAPAQLRPPGGPLYGHAYDLDQMTLDYVQAWPLIATRVSPVASRPPANYERAWTGEWYEVWRKRRPAPAAHETGGEPPDQPSGGPPQCPTLQALGPRRERLVAFERPPVALADLPKASPLPRDWFVEDTVPPRLSTRSHGTVAATTNIPTPGRHAVWAKGSFVRDSEVFVDGKRVGVARGVNGANQWVEVGSVELATGDHRVELKRPRGSLGPGDKAPDRIGPIAFIPGGEQRFVRATADRLCGRTLDWAER